MGGMPCKLERSGFYVIQLTQSQRGSPSLSTHFNFVHDHELHALVQRRGWLHYVDVDVVCYRCDHIPHRRLPLFQQLP
jgi:hypothetical protein